MLLLRFSLSLTFALLIMMCLGVGVLNSPTIIISLSASSFRSVSIYLIYLGAPMLGMCIFAIVLFSWWMTLLSLYILTFVSGDSFWLFLWYKYSSPCPLLVYTCMEYLFLSLHWSLCVFPKWNWSFCRQYTVVSCFIFLAIYLLYVCW